MGKTKSCARHEFRDNIMRNNRITVTVLLTALAVVFACGCTKPDDPNNGGGGGNNGGNSGGGHYNGNYEFVDLGLPSGTLWATLSLIHI